MRHGESEELRNPTGKKAKRKLEKTNFEIRRRKRDTNLKI